MHLHFDCPSGISGDMTLGALVDVGLPVATLARALKALPVKGYRLTAKPVRRGAYRATKVDVDIRTGFAKPLSVRDIHRMITQSRLPEEVKDTSHRVFERLTEAEGRAHGVEPAEVHFHEIGAVDSLVDVVGSVLGCHLLSVTRITASPVNLGSGTVQTSHGTLVVPGPAVSELAKGISVYSAGPPLEMVTPTGMALLTTLAQEWGSLPAMVPKAIGYGAGTADPLDWPNVLRVYLHEGGVEGQPDAPTGDIVVQLETNLDDLTPQAYETVMERLFEAGALDVTLTPVIMKRSRPGVVVTALVSKDQAGAVTDVLLRETTALGVRVQEVHRRVLSRRMESVVLPGGRVHIKVAELPGGGTKAAPEYVDCSAIARQTGRPVREVLQQAMQAYETHRTRATSSVPRRRAVPRTRGTRRA
jgi:uncharacterized protein (TIGR00299 family) protein